MTSHTTNTRTPPHPPFAPLPPPTHSLQPVPKKTMSAAPLVRGGDAAIVTPEMVAAADKNEADT